MNRKGVTMSITPRGMSVQEAYRYYCDDKFIVNRKYQRKLVWTLEEKQSLIDSMIKDYPVPLILLAEKINGKSANYEIIDGMQRLNAIFSFIENAYPINDTYFDINEFTRAKQAAQAGRFSPVEPGEKFLSPTLCANILDYQLAVTIFPIVDETQVTDVFGRINSGGRQLSWQEKRQAGIVNDFSTLIRRLASEIRGDASRDILPLGDMPEISIDSIRKDMGYALKAEENFWCKQGILWTKHLRDSEDEEMLADICASIILEKPIDRSKELLDLIYDTNSPEFDDIQKALSTYGLERLYEEIKVTLSVLRKVIEDYSIEPNALRSVINPKARNPVKASFFALFMAFHDLVIVEEKTPDDSKKIMEAIKGLQKSMISSAKYAKEEDRTKNIDKTKGLIQRYFIKKEPPMLRHGAGLALDLENSLRRSKVETARYECKQGFVSLSSDRKYDTNLPMKLLKTICGIANVGPDADGFIFLGVADNLSDANRIKALDGVDYKMISNRYIVGIDREYKILQQTQEQYLENIFAFIRSSELSDPLKDQILSQIDTVDYKGLSVIRIRIPAQNKVSFLGENAYIRENSSTIDATGKKLLATNYLFKN